MTEHQPNTVSDLTCLVADGEERSFARVTQPTGREPHFYRIGKSGYNPARPKWVNPIPLERRPRPPALNWTHVPLPTGMEFEFSINATRDQVADLCRISTGLFLVSDLVLGIIETHDRHPREVAPASVALADGSRTSGFKIVMPGHVLDVVDITKTDVTVVRSGKQPGPFVTHVKYPMGYLLRDDIAPDVTCFIERFSGEWLWRLDFVRAAIEAGARGLLAESTYASSDRPVIRS